MELNTENQHLRHAINFNRHIDISEKKVIIPKLYLQYMNNTKKKKKNKKEKKCTHTVQ